MKALNMFFDTYKNILQAYAPREKAMRAFEILMCMWVLLHAFKLYAIKDIVASPYSFCPKIQSSYFLGIDTFLIQNIPNFFLIGLFAQSFLALLIIWQGSFFVTRILLWLVTLNLFASCSYIGDGGTGLLCTLLLFYIFCDIKGQKLVKSGSLQQLAFCMVVFSMQLQVVIIYMEAALSKIRTDGWSSGIALYYILQMPEFSNEYLSSFLIKNDFFIVFATYGTIAFQLTFPFAMLKRQLKPIWLIFGLMLHVGIAVVMGLFSFGLFMVIVYCIFLQNYHIEWFTAKFKLKKMAYNFFTFT